MVSILHRSKCGGTRIQCVEFDDEVQDFSGAESDREIELVESAQIRTESGVGTSVFTEIAIFGVDVIRQIVIIGVIVSND